ncbi:MAG: tetratricopeptide repeat protein [Anaerolineae bacterium]
MAEATSLPSSYESLYQQAMESAGEGNTDAAIVTFRRIIDRLSTLSPATIERRPDLANLGTLVTNHLAGLLASGKRHDEAVETLRAGLRFHPDHADDVERDIAMVRAEEGRPEVAREALIALAEREPGQSSNWLALAQVDAKLGDVEAAEQDLNRAAAAATTPQSTLATSITRFRIAVWKGDVEQAVAAWDAAVAADPAVVAAQRDLYDFLLARGESTRLRRYLDADPVAARAGLFRGLLALRESDYAEARRHWERVVALNPMQEQSGHVEWLEAALRLGDTQKAAALISSRPPDLRSDRGALIGAIVMARLGRMTRARSFLSAGTGMLAGHFPWEPRYSFADWDLFTTLVEKREAWNNLKQYFDTENEQGA